MHTRTNKYKMSSLDLSSDRHWLVAMDDQQSVHVYSFRTRELGDGLNLESAPTYWGRGVKEKKPWTSVVPGTSANP